jgi:hypothetical protein
MSGRIEDRLNALKALPVIEPPAELESQTLSAMARAAAAPDAVDSLQVIARAAGWVVAIGAGVLLSVWLANDNAPDVPAELADAVAPPQAVDEFYSLLVEESMRLEELLALMPAPRRVMRADTASTIVGLEDRVALIDAALSQTGAEADVPEYRTALMLDRVEVMNALVNVRYAQSRAFVF